MIPSSDDLSSAPARVNRLSKSAERLQELFAEVGALANQLRKGADDSESVRQGDGAILKVLGNDGPLTVPEIGRIRATSRQNIQTLVNRLESEGCVALADNPAHRRSGLVHITEQGRAMLATVMAEEAKSLEKLLPHISETELTAATASLRRIRNLLTGTAPKPQPARPVAAAPKPRAVPARLETRPVAASEAKPHKDVSEDDFPLNLL